MPGDLDPATGDAAPRGSAYLAIGLTSAAILAYEVLLARLLAIVHWQSFAAMVISIALLGYGASGTLLALLRGRLLASFERSFALAAGGFGALAVGSFAVAQRLPFNALAVFWEPRQLGWLVGLYAVLLLPFLAGATAIGLALARWGSSAPRAYAADLIGAGLGASATLGLLTMLRAEHVLGVIAAAALGAAALVVHGGRGRFDRVLAGMLGIAALGAPGLVRGPWIEPRISEWKGLPKALASPGTAVVAERSGPMGLVSVVASREVPLREAPGLSPLSTHRIPEQRALFVDGDAMSAVTRFDGDTTALAFLDDAPQAAGYHVSRPARVLVIGAGGGSDVLLARLHGADRIDAVEANRDVVRLLRGELRAFAGGAFDPPAVRVAITDGRSFVEATHERYDLIQISLLDAPGFAAAGAASSSVSFLYTVESLETCLRKLAPGGWLAVSRWVEVPPRSSLKLAATAIDALRASGAPDPGARLAVIRGWNVVTLLVKNGAVDAADAAALARFAEPRLFDLDYVAGLPLHGTRRFNLQDQPYLRDGITALVGAQRDRFLAGYAFDVRPATDDRPFFHDFFRWRSLPRILALPPQGGAALLELGYPVLVATLVQATVLSAALVLVPLALRARRRRGKGVARAPRPALLGATTVYFGALGLAFLFVEIGFIQRLVLLLGHPFFALGLVLAAFLVFAGAGSALAGRITGAHEARAGAAVATAVVAIAAVSSAHAIGLPALVAHAAGWPLAGRSLLALALLAPLAVPMGVPFSVGLARLARLAPELVPWAWGVNGCASVLSALLAGVLSIHLGFRAVTVLAIVLYATAAVTFRRFAARC